MGAVGAISVARLAWTGWLDTLYALPTHHLAYPGLGWIPVPSPAGVRWLAALAGLAAVAFALGWRHRPAGAVFFLSFTWLELIEATTYLNHYWFLSSIVLLLTLLPANAAWSLDARAGRAGGYFPAWGIWALRAQVMCVYFFAGVAKLHADWLLEGLPLRLWLPSRSSLPAVGGLLELPAVAVAASWAGAVFDLTVGPLLLWKRSRPWAFAALVGFHTITGLLLPSLGVFPFVMTVAATVFFEPGWPRWWVRTAVRAPVPARTRRSWALPAVAAVWIAFQWALPLRQLTIPGDARWTGEGYRFSWNVVATEKSGSLVLWATDPRSGERSPIDPARYFTPQQLRVAVVEPDLILQLAHVIEGEISRPGYTPLLTADSWVSFNGRPPRRLLDPSVDLAALPIGTPASDYVLSGP
jgi:hypothetical protein